YVFDGALEGLFIDRMEQNEEIFTRLLTRKDLWQAVSEILLRQVYDQIKTEQAAETVTEVSK
ncbi:MAG: hypothetical protein SVO26_08720, partial [Chloroflexota bacterium]|nr:hypothetical protein [Chloroflexota bacterium]